MQGTVVNRGTTFLTHVQQLARYAARATFEDLWRVDDPLRQEIKEAVRALEGIQVKDLMELLSQVQVSR